MPRNDFFADALSAEPQPARPCIFVLYGATGDLAARKIAPAVFNLYCDGLLDENTVVLGVARRPRPDEQWREEMLCAIREHSRREVDEAKWKEFSQRWFYHVTHAGEQSEYETLKDRLAGLDDEYEIGGGRLFYMAMTPDLFGKMVRHMKAVGLNRPDRKSGFVRVVVEKPFGHDLNSARELNRTILDAFEESQIFRIDHYLGKETVQNMLILRFANAIFEPLFSRHFVDHIQISTTETSGMEGRRGPYYESVGAMRDMVQNHMLQLLALTAMEAPAGMNSHDIRDEKVKVLRTVRPLTPSEVSSCTVRGQYGPGQGDQPGYLQEKGVAKDSQVETYVALKTYVDNWRWSGVPFYLRTGKRLAKKASQILIVFKREPISLFIEKDCDLRGANRLAIRIAPDEGVHLVFDTKVPGPRMLLRPVKMDFQYDTAFGSGSPEAYEHLVLDAMRGDQTLFIRDDEVETAWRFVDSIRNTWEVRGESPLHTYEPGSAGPEHAEKLFDNPYHKWQPL